MKIPKSIQKFIWWAKVDGERDKKLLITSIFNRGDISDLQWVVRHYSPSVIKDSLMNPLRGEWWERSLRFYLKMYHIKLSSRVMKSAIKSLQLS